MSGFRNDGRVLVVEHEEIPGYMPAMVMPLSVEDTSITASLEEGEAIRFRLAVEGDSARITAIRAIPDSAVAPHPARTVIPMKSRVASNLAALGEGDRVPADLTLVNQAGKPIQIGEYRGQMLLLTFIYTRCPLPNYCLLMSKQFAALQPALRKWYGTQGQLLSISFDPAYDAPKALREYASRYTERLDNWTFATGDSMQIRRATQLFGVYTREKDSDQITHNLTTALVGPKGRVRRHWHGNEWKPKNVLRAVEWVVKGS